MKLTIIAHHSLHRLDIGDSAQLLWRIRENLLFKLLRLEKYLTLGRFEPWNDLYSTQLKQNVHIYLKNFVESP